MTDKLALSHFLDLLHAGNHPGASSGELRARRIAMTLVRDLPGLDAMAIDGLIDFARLCSCAPETAERLVQSKRISTEDRHVSSVLY